MPDPTEAQLIQQKLDEDSRAVNAHKTWRYRYRPGAKPERKLFNHPDDVPEGEGWVDSPALCEEPPEPVAPVNLGPDANNYVGEYSTNPPAANVEEMSTDKVTMAQIRSRYTEVTGGKAKVGLKKTRIQEMIRNELAGEPPHAA